jgi:hypothetical protein
MPRTTSGTPPRLQVSRLHPTPPQQAVLTLLTPTQLVAATLTLAVPTLMLVLGTPTLTLVAPSQPPIRPRLVVPTPPRVRVAPIRLLFHPTPALPPREDLLRLPLRGPRRQRAASIPTSTSRTRRSRRFSHTGALPRGPGARRSEGRRRASCG